MKIIDGKISKIELKELAGNNMYNLVKGVVDVENRVLAVDAPMHADIEKFLLEQGSRQENLWGINLYPEKVDAEFVEFDSMINLRPNQNNMSRGVDDEKLQQKIIDIVMEKIS